MGDDNNEAPGLTTLMGRLGRTSLGIVRNRAELLSVEWQEEKARLSRLLVLSLGMMFLALMTVGLFTATIISLIPDEYRLYALGGFSLIYAAGCLWAWFNIKALLKKAPFEESIEQVRKDAGWLERTE